MKNTQPVSLAHGENHLLGFLAEIMLTNPRLAGVELKKTGRSNRSSKALRDAIQVLLDSLYPQLSGVKGLGARLTVAKKETRELICQADPKYKIAGRAMIWAVQNRVREATIGSKETELAGAMSDASALGNVLYQCPPNDKKRR